jgi:hypothetical protein
LILHGPIFALTNLFINILQNPTHPRIQSDLALMDVGAGYLARLKFATDSEVSVDFAKDIAALAHGVANDKSHGSPMADNVPDNDLSRVRPVVTGGMEGRMSGAESAIPPDVNSVSPPLKSFLLMHPILP